MNSESDPWWRGLLRLSRPGSRTVLSDPDDAMAVEFARHGFRLMILRREPGGTEDLRRQLRELGLASQLMGSQSYRSENSLSLAPDFYELWVFCTPVLPCLWQAAQVSLKKGSPIYWQSDFGSLPYPGDTLEGLPASIFGVRA